MSSPYKTFSCLTFGCKVNFADSSYFSLATFTIWRVCLSDIFSRINSAKFKKMVQPGDQVVFDIELVSYKMNSCKLSGKAMVNDEIVAESEFMATVTDKEF